MERIIHQQLSLVLLDWQENLVLQKKFKGIEDIKIAKQPLYTTKPELERSGMGFTIMDNFMDSLKVESVVGMGTKVTMEKKINNKNTNENLNQEENFYV